MVAKILVATLFLAGVACCGIAIFYFASAMFSARSEYAAKKRGYVLDLVPFLLLTPFVYNKVGRSYFARAICYGVMCGLLILLSGVAAETAGIVAPAE
jgi:hypothetical protein